MTMAEETKKADVLRQKKEELELRRESARKRHVRPWDKDKKSTVNATHCSDDEQDWKPLRERHIMSQGKSLDIVESQECMKMKTFQKIYIFFMCSIQICTDEWNEMKRKERNYEFAPMDFVSGESGDKYPMKRQHQSPERRDKSMRTSTFTRPSSSKASTMEESISAGLKFLREQVEQGNSEKFLYSKNKQL